MCYNFSNMLDEIDRKILNYICKDANISNVKLAKTIGVNANTVAKRIDVMLQKDMITIKAALDFARLGYKVEACIALNVDLSSINKLIAIVKESPGIHLAVTTFGRYDILMLGSFTDLNKLNLFLREDIPHWPGVRQINVFIIAEVKKLHRDMFHNRSYTGPPVVLDDINQKLIQELTKNGLTSHADIARNLGVNQATISRRVASLLKKGIIKIVAVPNPSKFGYLANAYIMLGTEHANVNEICAELNKHPQILYSVTLMVGFDILTGVQFPNPELLYQFIKEKMSLIRGISTIETLIVAENIKATYTRVDFDNLP